MKNIERLFRDLNAEEFNIEMKITFDEAGWHVNIIDVADGMVILDPSGNHFLVINSDYSVQDALEQMDTVIENGYAAVD